MDRYPAPATKQRFDAIIKRSRFITTVLAVPDKRAALIAIQAVRDEFPDANHHCWAMVAGIPTDVYHQDQSDDGEPKGTAGKPMLNVLQHSGLGNTAVVVTRYFGGIKLGAGGLVRAYTQSVSNALSELNTVTAFIKIEMSLLLPYSQLATFEHWLKNTDITVVNKEFSDTLLLQLAVPESDADALLLRVNELGGELTEL